jgi:hypothetical protein
MEGWRQRRLGGTAENRKTMEKPKALTGKNKTYS